MKGKRIGTSVLAALMLAGTTATSALAAMPDRTAVIGGKAFSMKYALASENEKEIRTAIQEAFKAGEKIYVKSRNVWYNNDETKLTDTSVIPAVVYKSAEGEVSYEAGDGEEATEGFAIKEISATAVSEITVSFTEAVSKEDQEKAKFEIKKGKADKTWDKVSWNDEGTEAVISLEARIIDGEYSVEVKGLDLDENKRTFTGENERVEAVEFVSAEKVPYIVTKEADTDTTQNDKVIVNYKIVNQYGDKTNLGSETVNGGYTKTDSSRTSTTFEIPESLFSSPLVKEIPMSISIVVTDNNKVVTANKMLKIVRPALINDVKIGKMYVLNNDGTKLVEASKVTESADKTIYLALDATTQYGGKVDKTFIQNRFGDVVPVFGTTSTSSQADKDRDIKNITQFGNFSVTPSGIAAATGQTSVEKDLYFNTLDANDTTLYLKVRGNFNSRIPASVMVFAGSESTTGNVEVDASSNLAQIAFTFPEVISGGEVVKLENIEAFNQNGEAMKDKDIYDVLVAKKDTDAKIISASQNQDTLEYDYDEVKEKLTIKWTAPSNTQTVDIPVSFTTRTETDKFSNILKSVRPNAKITQATMNKDALAKFVKATNAADKGSQTFDFSDITAYDQYGRKMSVATIQSLKSNITFYKGTDVNDASAVLAVAGTRNLADGTETNYYTISAEEAVKNQTYSVKVAIGTKTDVTSFKVETVKADAIKTIDMTAPEVVYGGSTNADYAGNFSVYGKTEAGAKVILVEGEHYELTIPTAEITATDNTTSQVALFNLNGGKLSANTAITMDAKTVAARRTEVFGANDAYKKGFTLFAVASVGKVAEPAAKNVELTVVSPKLTTFKLKNDAKVQKFDEATMTTADIKKFFTIEDQYGVDWAPAPTYVFVQNNKTEAGVFTDMTNITGLQTGDSFELRVYYGQKFEVVKVVVDRD